MPPAPRPATLARHRDFQKLWAGQTVSVFGSMVGGAAMDFTAILVLQASPFQLGLLSVARQVPAFLAGLFAGAWIDRRRRRPILIAADAGRALLLASIPVSALLGVLRLEQLLLVAFLASVLTLVFDVAYQAYLPSLIPRERLLEGNSKLAASASVAELSGFSLAGWLVQWLTAPIALAVDALSFVVSALAMLMIRAREPAPIQVEGERADIWRDIGAGLRVVVHDPFLRPLAGATIVTALAGGMVGATIVLFQTRELGFSPGVLGLIWAVGGLTSLAGALLATPVAGLIGLGRALVVGLGLTALGTLLVPLAQGTTASSVLLLVANQVITDPADTIYRVNEVTLRQSVVPDRLLGRVSATIRVLGLGCTLLGALAGGLLAQTVGVRLALLVGASGGLVAALLLVGSPVWS